MFILQIVHSAQVGWNYINIIQTPLEVAKAKLRLSKAMEISLNILIYTSKENKKHAASFWGLTLSISNKIQRNSLPKKKKKHTESCENVQLSYGACIYLSWLLKLLN